MMSMCSIISIKTYDQKLILNDFSMILPPNLTYIEGIYSYINHLDIIYDMTPTKQKVSSVRVLSLHECFFLFASSIYGLDGYG